MRWNYFAVIFLISNVANAVPVHWDFENVLVWDSDADNALRLELLSTIPTDQEVCLEGKSDCLLFGGFVGGEYVPWAESLVSGYFVYDADTSVLSDFYIQAGDVVYSDNTVLFANGGTRPTFTTFSNSELSIGLQLVLDAPLTNSGGYISLRTKSTGEIFQSISGR